MKDESRRLYAAAAAYELDRRAIHEHGIPGYALMQRAAAAAWRAASDRWIGVRRIAVICGSGNNGGDGYEFARLAEAAGCTVRLFALGEPVAGGDAAQAAGAWRTRGQVIAWTAAAASELMDCELIVDALFGIGLSRRLEGDALLAVQAINRGHAAGVGVLALDVPSGLAADTGAVLGEAVTADLTTTFIARKAGLFTGQGPAHCGLVVFDDLAVPVQAFDGVPGIGQLLAASDLGALLPQRSRAAHKGSNGHVLVVGGDHGTAGAVLIAARAALRVGAGLVSVATRAEHAGTLVAAQPELMCRGVANAEDLAPMIGRASVIAVGPGLGTGSWGRALFDRVISAEVPLVVDADALNLLAERPASATTKGWVLTPHPGEAGRLLGIATSEVEADRFSAIAHLRERFGGTVLLKGAGTLIQGESLSLCPFGNPGMATGGMGDALTGIIAGLIAQKLSPEQAAVAGVLAHALAGDSAARDGERGLLPSDLIAHLREVVNA